MYIAKETKERFVKMLKAHQIIVIQCNKGSNRKNYDYKFIGADVCGRYDFTPLIAEYSGYKSNNNESVMYLSVRGLDAAAIIADTLDVLRKENVFKSKKTNYELYEEARSLICTFYI